ncbi:MAG: hypothetical protein WCL28_01600 [bacterium]
MVGLRFWYFVWMAFLVAISASCSKAVETGSGKTVYNPPVDSSPGIRTYRIDPSVGGALSANGLMSTDPSFSAASLVIPPGSLSIPVNIDFFEAQSLVPVTDPVSAAYMLTSAGPAVAVIPNQQVSLTSSMSIAIPYSARGALTDIGQLAVIAVYPGLNKNEYETFVGSELDLGTSGVVKLSISRFGAFQVVYSGAVIDKLQGQTDIQIVSTVSGSTTGENSGTGGGGTTVTPKKIFDAPLFDGPIPISYKYAFGHRNAVVGDNKILIPNSFKEPGASDSDSSYRPRLTMIDSQGQLVTQFGSDGHVIINNQLIPNGFGIAAAVDNENGRIYLAGAYNGQSKGFVAAMNFKGELISTFGTNGVVTFGSRVEQVEVSAGGIYVSYHLGLERLYLDGAKDTSFSAGATGENFVIDGNSIFVAGYIVYWNPYHEDSRVSKLNLATGALLGSKNIDMPGSREYGQLIFKHGDFLYVSARSTTESEDNQLVVKLNKNLQLDSSFASGGLVKKAGGGACEGMVPLAGDKLLFSCWAPWLLSTAGSTLDAGDFRSTDWLTLAHGGQRVVGVSNGRTVIYNNPFWSCQSSFESEKESCFDPNLGNVIAAKTRTCNAAKTGFDYGACTAVDLGVPKICSPSSSSSVSCVGESNGSTAATKTKSCDSDGLSYTYGACLATACAPGFTLNMTTKACVAQICVPNAPATPESCIGTIANSSVASRPRTCSSDGLSYIPGTCSLTSCNSGFYKSGNSCIAQVCNPSDTAVNVDCKTEKLNSNTATKSKTCNSIGSAFDYGTCNVSSCNSGYYVSNNSCLAQICTPGQPGSDQSCTASFPVATATQSRTCNSEGSNWNLGTCTAKSCTSGYELVGSSCNQIACSPNATLSTASCTSEKPNSLTAEKTRSCNSAGNNYVFGSCNALTCKPGFELLNGSCSGVSDLVKGMDFPFNTYVGPLGTGADGAQYAVINSAGACWKLTRNGVEVGDCGAGFKLFMKGAFVAAVSGSTVTLRQLTGAATGPACHETSCTMSAQGVVNCNCKVGAGNSSFTTTYAP